MCHLALTRIYYTLLTPFLTTNPYLEPRTLSSRD
jgi:hypothetical protein